MKNKKQNNTILLLVAAAAAYYFFFMKKKPGILVTSPGMPDQPAEPVAMLQPMIQTESVSIAEEIKNFGEGNPQPQHSENIYQNYYVNQVSGVKRMGVPYTI
jgi:hypothetical protein